MEACMKVLNIPCRMQPVLKDIVCIRTIVASYACPLLHHDAFTSIAIILASINVLQPLAGLGICKAGS